MQCSRISASPARTADMSAEISSDGRRGGPFRGSSLESFPARVALAALGSDEHHFRTGRLFFVACLDLVYAAPYFWEVERETHAGTRHLTAAGAAAAGADHPARRHNGHPPPGPGRRCQKARSAVCARLAGVGVAAFLHRLQPGQPSRDRPYARHRRRRPHDLCGDPWRGRRRAHPGHRQLCPSATLGHGRGRLLCRRRLPRPWARHGPAGTPGRLCQAAAHSDHCGHRSARERTDA